MNTNVGNKTDVILNTSMNWNINMDMNANANKKMNTNI